MMAEVCAPLAKLDGEDWLEHDYRLLSNTLGLCNTPFGGAGGTGGNRMDGPAAVAGECANRVRRLDSAKNEPSSGQSVPDNCTLPDVSSTLMCFRLEQSGVVEIISEDVLLNDSPVWRRVTETYVGAMPVDWNKSHSRRLQEHALNVNNKLDNAASEVIDLSDDEDLQQAMDLHRIIVNSADDLDEPVISADQVISEIEEMMQESIYMEGHRTLDDPSKTAQLVRRKVEHTSLPHDASIQDCLTKLSLSDLVALQDELEGTIVEYSEVLVQELALREELDFHKESNNHFISLLLSIQKKRREYDAERRKALQAAPTKKSSTDVKSTSSANTYLTTVIPYDHHEGVPDAERLQIYIKIMSAIDSDSPTVPSILTDYILKVLCPNT